MISTFKKFFQFSGAHKSKWYKAIALELLRSLAGTLQMIPLFLVLANVIRQTLTARVALLSFLLVLLSVVLQVIFHYLGYRLEMRASYKMLDDKRISIGERMRYMPMGFFSNRSLGNLTAIATSTMDDLEALASSIVVRILTGYIHAVMFSLGYMIIDWRIGTIFLAGILVILVVNRKMLVVARAHSPQRLAAQMKLVDAVLEFLQGMSVVKAFNLSERSDTSFKTTIEETEKQNYNLETKSIPFNVLQQIILRMFAVAAIAAAVKFYFDGSMELFITLLVLIGGFMTYAKLEMAGALSFMLPTIDNAMDRIQEVDSAPFLDGSGRITDSDNNDIVLENIDFSYENSKVIDDVSLLIPQRTSCAIVGPSGSGKTTLVNLMARFWDVDSGSVKLGGVDVREWKFDEFMTHFAMVFQNVYLFNDTIENNIKVGRPSASHEEVVQVAKAARCHDFIATLPDGYDTVLGEGGANVSGGEKQRISIARALLKDAPIVLLDEATANVDPENEAELQSAIETLTRDKTVIMIAHRLKTVRNADQIVVLDKGRIVQRGTHAQLLEQGGIYASFVQMRRRAIGWKVGAN